MKINNIGYNHIHDADFQIHRPDGSGDYLLLLLKTPAIFNIHNQNYLTEADSFILYKKGTPQYYRAQGSYFSNDWLHFDMSEETLNVFSEYQIPFDTVIPLKNINDLSLFIKNISYEHYSSNPYREESATLYLKLLFMKLSEKLHAHPDETIGTYYERMSLIRSQIYNMPYYDWNVPDMAHQLAISKSYFQHMYKQIFGTGAMDDVIQSRIHHAKYLLSTTMLSVKEISTMCGYKNETHFMRQFKSCEGITPSQYRSATLKA